MSHPQPNITNPEAPANAGASFIGGSMNKFVIGDHVRITLPGDQHFDKVGVVVYVLQATPYDYRVAVDGKRPRWFREEQLVLAEAPETTDPGGRRATILRTAEKLINGQRAKDYGDASENFQRIADLWKVVLGIDVTPEQVALCLTQLKVARLITSPAHEDSWIDACGYLALGGEIAGKA